MSRLKTKLTVHEMKTDPKYQNRYPEYQNQGKRSKVLDVIDNICQAYFLLLGFSWLSDKVTPKWMKDTTKGMYK